MTGPRPQTPASQDLTREVAWVARRARDISTGHLAGRTPTTAELAEFDRRKAAVLAATDHPTTGPHDGKDTR